MAGADPHRGVGESVTRNSRIPRAAQVPDDLGETSFAPETLGTLLRTCDAVGACIAVPDTKHYRAALKQGDTLGPRRRPCIHWLRTNKDRWIEQQRNAGWRIVAVELADGALGLPRLQPATQRTVILLGHEWHGIPDEQVEAADLCIEIPMVGQGASLNVAVAGSLVLYKLAGMT